MPATDEEVLAELRKIRELLTPAVPSAKLAPKGLLHEFRDFLSQYKVLGLAVAFILGVYLGELVKALVTDLILPVVQFALLPDQSINTLMVGPFGIGDFANALLTFLIVAFVVFLIVKIAKRYKID